MDLGGEANTVLYDRGNREPLSEYLGEWFGKNRRTMLKKTDYVKIIKTAAGAALAIVLAEALGLKYSSSAGVITLLSIQDTKKETLRVVARRVISFVAALVISAACFRVFGYGAAAIAVFLVIFSAICIRFRMQEGISVNTVLMLHFFAEHSMTVRDIGNEAALLLIGAGIGVILNLYIPGKRRQIIVKQRQIEEEMKVILGSVAKVLAACCTESENGFSVIDGGSVENQDVEETLKTAGKWLEDLEAVLAEGERDAYEELENKLLSESKYYIRYMNMRRTQSSILSRIIEDISHLAELPPQSCEIAGLVEKIKDSFHECNNALALLDELEFVRQSMRNQPLPTVREEFENRAVLYGILLELEQLLTVKKEFVEKLTEEEKTQFWSSAFL